MTSVIRQFSNNSRLPDPFPAVALIYGDYQAVPLTYDKLTGVLDFDFSSGFSASTDIHTNDSIYFRGCSLNAILPVSDIGPNMVAWLEGGEVGADSGSVKVVEKPIVVRANQVALGRDPNSDDVMEESDVPFDFDKASGTVTSSYNATYLFKKPLVVEYTVASVKKYRMFNTQFEGNT